MVVTSILALITAAVSFTLSASAGMGGSLILIPVFVMLYGAKEGVALGALFLASNNLAKLVVYRKTIPLKHAFFVVFLTFVGALFGASILVIVPGGLVVAAVLASILGSFFLEQWATNDRVSHSMGAFTGFLSGATSGLSGTSGPLKGVALRSLKLQHLYLVGAASAVSFVGDLTKVVVFSHASLLDEFSFSLWALAIPIMPIASLLGRRINRRLGERYFKYMFWAVMIGYSVRLLFYYVM